MCQAGQVRIVCHTSLWTLGQVTFFSSHDILSSSLHGQVVDGTGELAVSDLLLVKFLQLVQWRGYEHLVHTCWQLESVIVGNSMAQAGASFF